MLVWGAEMKEKLKAFFKNFTIFDIVFLSIAYPLLIVVSLLCGSDAMTITYSLVAVSGIFLLTKGSVVAPMVITVAYTLYAILSYQTGLYGETIIYCALLIPIQIATIILWLMKKKKDNNQFIIARVGWKHWLILLVVALAFGVGAYFLLQAFNTKYLILSTIIMVVCSVSNYLTLIKSEYSFAGFILNNVIFCLLWILPLANGEADGLAVLPMVVSGVLFTVLNIKGLIAWLRMKKQQRNADEIEQKIEKEIEE